MVKALAFTLLVFHQLAFSVPLKPTDITTATLDNGLKIIVKVDHRSPVFIAQLWYRVGGSDEPRPLTGISHMLEHMMFKGTVKYPAGEFSKIIARNGGDDNAFTSRDYTAYYQKMHKSKLALAIEMEAERMGNLVLSEDEFIKERKVVIEERRLRIEDNPNAQVYENLQLISFAKNGAYHAPIIGFQEDIENYTLNDLKHWYKKYYAPNNATLVVVGDVNPVAVIALAKQYFGNYQHQADIVASRFASIPLKSKTSVLKLKAKLPFYLLSFQVPSLKTTDDEKTVYALEMLAYVLDNSLSKTLIRQQQIVSKITLNYRLYDKFNTLFTLAFVPAQGVSHHRILSAIQNQVIKLIQNPNLIKAELTRIQAQLESDFVFQQDQISTQAYYLGRLGAVGLPLEKLFTYVEQMNHVKASEIAKVAQQYLDFSSANSVELIPQGLQ